MIIQCFLCCVSSLFMHCEIDKLVLGKESALTPMESNTAFNFQGGELILVHSRVQAEQNAALLAVADPASVLGSDAVIATSCARSLLLSHPCNSPMPCSILELFGHRFGWADQTALPLLASVKDNPSLPPPCSTSAASGAFVHPSPTVKIGPALTTKKVPIQ